MKVVHYIYFFLLYFTIILFFIKRKKLEHSVRIMFVYLVVLALFNSFAMYTRVAHGSRNNLYLYHILTPLEYVLLCLMFISALDNHILKKAIKWSIVGFLAVCVILEIFVEGREVNNSYARTIESLLITLWILLYFGQLLTTVKILTFHTQPLFWINMGLLIYFLGTLFIQGFINYLLKHDRALAALIYKYEYIFEYVLFVQIIFGVYSYKLSGLYKKQKEIR